MARKYAVGHKAWFICQRCGLRGLYRDSVFDGQIANLRVHSECFEPRHPQESLPKVTDPIALFRPSPEMGGTPPVLTAVYVDGQPPIPAGVELNWTEAEVFNARFESYDVYRALIDPQTNEPGDYTLLTSLPITYDEFMAIVSQTLTYTDTDVDPSSAYAYKVIANASNGAGDPDGDFSQISNIANIEEQTYFRLLEDGDFRLMEDNAEDRRLLEEAP